MTKNFKFMGLFAIAGWAALSMMLACGSPVDNDPVPPPSCVHEGKTFGVGERYTQGCGGCQCMEDGSWGFCTGYCPDKIPEVTCERDGVLYPVGTVVSRGCGSCICLASGEFGQCGGACR
ncbi:MAG TPA: hypothetical protein VFQ61_23365 [Polyangiaceae bacterium]|nr:hypothetical protein [Polyangiaceae bacterium]